MIMPNKYDKRVYAGYYKRYDGKLIYVVTLAKDSITGEDTVIYKPYSIKNDDYYTISKKDFCKPVKIDGKLKARYKRQTQMRIDQLFIDTLRMDDMPAPKRKIVCCPEEIDIRNYRDSNNYYEYAKDLCEHYLADVRKYRLCKEQNELIGISKENMVALVEDLNFLRKCLRTELKNYYEFFNDRYAKNMSIRKYAETHSINRGSVEHIQRKLYTDFARLLSARDKADGVTRILLSKVN